MDNQNQFNQVNVQPIAPMVSPVLSPTVPAPVKRNNSTMIVLIVSLFVLVLVGMVIVITRTVAPSTTAESTAIIQPTVVPSISIFPSVFQAEVTSSPLASEEANVLCKNIVGVPGYQRCSSPDGRMADYIKGPGSLKIEHVINFSVSPNNLWMLVEKFSDRFVKDPGAPDESALTMVDIKSGSEYVLYPQIYFPSFLPEGWSSDGTNVVFSYDGNDSNYWVDYCSTTCKVISKNIGSAEIGPGPAPYFNGDKVFYNDDSGNPIEILVK